jgi:hypothetical protein
MHALASFNFFALMLFAVFVVYYISLYAINA